MVSHRIDSCKTARDSYDDHDMGFSCNVGGSICVPVAGPLGVVGEGGYEIIYVPGDGKIKHHNGHDDAFKHPRHNDPHYHGYGPKNPDGTRDPICPPDYDPEKKTPTGWLPGEPIPPELR